MNPYDCSRLARVIYEERVREALARNAADDDGSARISASRMPWEQRGRRPRFQSAVRWLAAALFLS